MNQAVKLPLVDVNPLAAYMKQSSSGPASYSQFSHTRMQKVADVWSKCEKYHFRVLGRMTTLRQVAITPNPEIRPENAQQCSGLAEHLLSVQLQQRRIMSEFLPGYAALLCLVNRSTNMVGGTEDAVADVCDSTTSQQTVTVLVEAAKWAVDGILALLAETRLVCGKDSAKLDGATAKKIEEAAQTLKLEVDMLYREIAISFGGQRPVASQHLIAGTASCSEGVVNLLGTMVQWAERDGSAALPTVCRQSVVLFVADARSRLDEANAKSGGAAAAVVDTATEAAEMDEDSPEAMAAFTASYNSIMSHLLSKVVAVGKVKSETDANLTKAANDKKIEADPDAMRAKSLVLLHKDLVAAFRALNLQSLNAKLQQLSTSVAAETSTDSAQSTALQAKLLRQLSPFLFQFLSLCDRLIAEFSELHRSICKLSLIVSGLFADILKRGFCGPVEEVEGDGEDQDGELDGTGMAEGDGSKDVSEEIEDEEQVLGNQDDKPEDDNDKDIEEEDNAIDMANEFDGELYDPEENEEDEKSDDDFDEDELDQQMGETDFDKSEQTEEQQLQESDDDGKDLDDDGMEGGTSMGDTELAAKEDDGPEPQGQDGPDDENKEPPKPQQEQDSGEQPEDNVNDDYQEDGENDVDPKEENKKSDANPDDQNDEEDDDKDGPTQADEEELDGDRQGDDEQKDDDGPDEDGTDAAEMDTENEKETADGMDVEDDEGDEGADPDEKDQENAAQEDAPDGLDDAMDDETQEPPVDDDAMEQEGELGQENDADAADEEDAGPNEPEDQEKQMGTPDEEKDTPVEDEQASKDDVQVPDNENDKVDSKEEEDKQEQKEETATSVAQTASAVVKDEENQANNAVLDDANLDGQDVSQGQAGDEQANASSLNAQGNSQTNTAPQEEMGANQNYEHSQKANPYRSVGDALKAWQDRLKVYDVNEAKEDHGDDDAGSQQNDPQAAEAFSHMDDDSQGYDAQVLDTANEEQQRKAQINPLDEGAEQATEDPDNIVDESALEPQPEVMDDTEDVSNQNDVTTDAADAGSVPLDADGLVAKIKEEQPKEDAAAVPASNPEGEVEMLAPGLGAETAVEDTLDSDDKGADEHEFEELRTKLEEDLNTRSNEDAMQASQAIERWHGIESLTSPLAQNLCEKLRLILEESKIAKLQGDYRTGKRLNMRKIIPYIASEFRKDKIWLRRTKPSKREYQIMLAIDDSQSMKQYHSEKLALEALSVIGKALTTLEAGELSVMSFGEETRLLHPFGAPFTEQSGASILQAFQFDQAKSNIADLLQAATAVFEGAKANSSSTAQSCKQLLFVVSDSDQLHQEGTSLVERMIRQVNDAGIFLVFVIIDSPLKQHSILKQLKTVFKDGKVTVDDYMDRFSDKRYIVLQDINLLPMQVGDALRQWFEIVANSKND